MNKFINDRSAGEDYRQEQRFKFSKQIPQHLIAGSGKGYKCKLIFYPAAYIFFLTYILSLDTRD